MFRKVRHDWGYCLYWLQIAIVLTLSLFHNVAGHYIQFTEPAHLLWHGSDPYAVDFGTGGAYFYSPSCAMFFFGLFAWLPRPVGQFLYLLTSLACFTVALNFLLRTVRDRFGFDLRNSAYRNLFWLMLGSEMIGALLATKVELFMVGVLLLGIALVIRGEKALLTGFLLAMIVNWKFQPAPVVALVLLVTILMRRQFWTLISFVASSLFFLLIPALFLPAPFLLHVTRHWVSSTREYVQIDWLRAPIFQHVYAFAYRGLGIPVSLGTANGITCLVGLGFAAYLLRWLWPLRRRGTGPAAETAGLLIALGLGSAFTAIFSPLSQSNAYLIYTPLLIPIFIFAGLTRQDRRAVFAISLVAYWLISIAYSDLTPRPIYHRLYYDAVKPLGVILLIALLFHVANSLRRQMLEGLPVFGQETT